MPVDSQQVQVERPVERNEDGQFVAGQSGNPAGRPPGARNRATVLAEQLFDGASGALANKAVQMALAGDAAALRLCLARIIAPRRHRPTGFTLPPLRTGADLKAAMTAIGEAVADGVLSSSEAAELSQYVESFARVIEAGEVEDRLQRLERVNGITS